MRLIGKSAELFFGWRVVGAAFIVAVFAWGIGFYGPPIFLQTLHATHRWPISVISAAITTQFLIGAAIISRLARLHQRFGTAAVTRAGGVLTAIGVLGWAFAGEPWQLFLAAPFAAAGWATTSGAALNAMISPWFLRRRPAALSMAFNGASLGGVIFSPLWVALISRLGFHLAAICVAATVTVALWVIAGRYLRPTPQALGVPPDGEAASVAAAGLAAAMSHPPLTQPWRDRRFVTLAAAASFGLFAQIGLIAHLFSLLVPTLGRDDASLVMGAATACAIAGRFALAPIMRVCADRRWVAAGNVVLQAIGSVALLLAAGQSVPLLLFGTLLFGLALGNVTSLPPLIVQAEFAPADVGRVVALTTACSQATYAFAPALFGALRDLAAADGPAGSAPALFAVAAIVQLAAAAAILSGRQARRR